MLYMKEMRANVVAECTLKESAAINQILGRRVCTVIYLCICVRTLVIGLWISLEDAKANFLLDALTSLQLLNKWIGVQGMKPKISFIWFMQES